MCVCVLTVCVFVYCKVFARACVFMFSRKDSNREEARGVGGGGQSGIKGSAAMNVIQIKPSRILRFSL